MLSSDALALYMSLPEPLESHETAPLVFTGSMAPELIEELVQAGLVEHFGFVIRRAVARRSVQAAEA